MYMNISDFSQAQVTLNEDNQKLEDALFDMFRTDDYVPVGKFLAVSGIEGNNFMQIIK